MGKPEHPFPFAAGEEDRPDVRSEAEKAAAELDAVRQLREAGDTIFEQRLRALSAASDHLREIEGAHRLDIGDRIKAEVELASYLIGAPRVAVDVLGSAFRAFAQHSPDSGATD